MRPKNADQQNMATKCLADGALIRDALLSTGAFADRAKRRFLELAGGAAGVAGAQVREAAEAEAAALLLGADLASAGVFVVPGAWHRLPVAPDDAAQFDEALFERTLRDYLQAVADLLQAEPVEVSVMDGSVLRTLLEDEDEFAMVSEEVFTDLDEDNSGKLNRKELRTALEQLVTEIGLPAPSAKPEMGELVSKLITKYADQGSDRLGQTQFAKVLQDVLQDLADSLAAHPIVMVRNVKVLDGAYIRKVLDDEQLLSEVAESTFRDLDTDKDGKLGKAEIRPFFESKAVQWGLPPHLDSEEIYSLVFTEIDADKSGDVDKDEFQVLMKAVFESFALQLSMSPIVVAVETAAQAC